MDKVSLQRYVEGVATEREIEVVVDWLDADENNVKELVALHKLYDISLFGMPDDKRMRGKIARNHRRIVFGYRICAAAALALLLIGIKVFWGNDRTEGSVAYQTLSTPVGQRAVLLLPDSTKVWLSSKTTLVYPSNFEDGERTVKLDGEAYFEVTHSRQKPFVVTTDKMSIKVLGTEFNVSAYSGRGTEEVGLLKGSVEVQQAAGGAGGYVVMKPNEKVELREGVLYTSDLTFDYQRWKDGTLSIDNESVESIMNKLEVYFDVKINVQKQDLMDARYTGKFRIDDGVDQVLRVLQLEHKFVYTKDIEHNMITIQ